MAHEIHVGDVATILPHLADHAFDAVLTDPPYGLGDQPDAEALLVAWLMGEVYSPGGSGFMGKKWDAIVPGPAVWREVLRVMKPGALAYVFAGDRTMDLMGMALRLAKFRMKGTTAWVYGSGFPKSLDLGKAIDAYHGAERQVVGQRGHAPKFVEAGNGGYNRPCAGHG